MDKCTGNCDGANEGKTVEFAKGVTACLCATCTGQAYADVINDLKSYGFKAAMNADDHWDTLKGIG